MGQLRPTSQEAGIEARFVSALATAFRCRVAVALGGDIGLG
jgi:hypothetical protein